MLMNPKELASRRRRAGMTQVALAKAVGVSQSYIARLENGSLDPKLSIVNRISEILTGYGMTCAEVMTANPITVDARAPVSEAVEIMSSRGFSQLPVVRGRVAVGMITERDVIRNLTHDLNLLSVEAIMESISPPQVDEKTQLKGILPLFDEFQAVLVQESGKLNGIITRSDLLNLGSRQPANKL